MAADPASGRASARSAAAVRSREGNGALNLELARAEGLRSQAAAPGTDWNTEMEVGSLPAVALRSDGAPGRRPSSAAPSGTKRARRGARRLEPDPTKPSGPVEMARADRGKPAGSSEPAGRTRASRAAAFGRWHGWTPRGRTRGAGTRSSDRRRAPGRCSLCGLRGLGTTIRI